jgi:hypothetical protein
LILQLFKVNPKEMAEFKHTLSQLRTAKKVVRGEIRRLVRALTCLLPYRLALILAPRPARRTRGVTKFEIGGNITRSFILLPQVHVDGSNVKVIVAGFVVIVIVVVNVVTTTSPNAGATLLRPFARGDSYHLDVVVAPFRIVNPSDKACEKLAQDFTDRMSRAVVNSDAQRVAIWMPEQVAGALAQASKEGMDLTQFVDDRQVDVLFHGDIECDDQKATVRPHVIAPALFYRGTPEMIGFYNFDDLTRPLQVVLGDNTLEQAALEAAGHVSTLVDMGRGIRLIAASAPDELREASALFAQLINAGSVSDRRGLALLHYLAGKAALASAAIDCNPVDPGLLQQAENSFSTALLHEPEFALAQAQLGNIALRQARALSESSTSDITVLLTKSLSRFQRALDARVQPASQLAVTIALVGQAQAQIALHDLIATSGSDKSLLTAASAQLSEVIRIFDTAGTAPEMQATVAVAYALMGDLQRAGFNDDRALAFYGRVAFLTDDRRLKTAAAQSMAELYTVHANACAAAQKYLMAAQTACEADSETFAKQAEQMQFYCQQTNDARTR